MARQSFRPAVCTLILWWTAGLGTGASGQALAPHERIALEVSRIGGATERRLSALEQRVGSDPKSAVPVLRSMVRSHGYVDSLRAARDVAARLLARIDPAALHPELDHSFANVRKAAFDAILEYEPLRRPLNPAPWPKAPFTFNLFVHPERLEALGLPAVPTLFDCIHALGHAEARTRAFALAALRTRSFRMMDRMDGLTRASFDRQLNDVLSSDDARKRRGAALYVRDPKRLRSLLDDADPRVRRAALEAVRWLADRKRFDVNGIVGRLDDADDEVVARAAWILRDRRTLSPEAISKLQRVLQEHESPLARGAAAEALARCARLASTGSIRLRAVRDPDPYVRWAALQASFPGEDRSKILTTLAEGLADPDPWVRAAAANRLAGAPDKTLPAHLGPALLRAIDDSAYPVRERAIRAIARVKPPSQPAIDALVRRLEDPVPDVRGNAAMTLGRVGAASAVPALIAALKSDDAGFRRRVVWGLGQLGPGAAAAVPGLIRLLADNKTNRRLSGPSGYSYRNHPYHPDPMDYNGRAFLGVVADALRRVGTPGVPALLEAARGTDEAVAARSVLVLGAIDTGSTPSAKALLPLLRARDRRLRLATVRAIGWIGDARDEVLSALRAVLLEDAWVTLVAPDLFVHHDDALRREVLDAYLRLDRGRINALLTCEWPGVRELALQRLAGDPKRKPRTRPPRPDRRCRSRREALKSVDLPATAEVASLLAALGSSDENRRSVAAAVLGACPRPVPRTPRPEFAFRAGKPALSGSDADAILAALQDENPLVRWGAALAARNLATSDRARTAAKRLAGLFADPEPNVRLAAVESMHRLPSEATADALKEAPPPVNDSDRRVSAEAHFLLSVDRTGKAAAEATPPTDPTVVRLAARLREPRSAVEFAGASAAYSDLRPQVPDPLVAALDHREPGIRFVALHRLCRIAPWSVPDAALERAFAEPSAAFRRLAGQVLLRRKQEVTPALTGALHRVFTQDTDPLAALFAASVVRGRTGRKVAARLYQRILDDVDLSTCEVALKHLEAQGRAGVEGLVTLLDRPEFRIHYGAGRALEKLGTRALILRLVRSGRSDRAKAAGLRMLGGLSWTAPAGRPEIRAMLPAVIGSLSGSKDPRVFRLAAEIVERLCGADHRAVAHLRAAAKDPKREHVHQAAQALLAPAGTGRTLTVKEIAACLRDPNYRDARGLLKRLAALGPKAAPAVKAIALRMRLQPSIRHEAADVLGRIGPAAAPAVTALVETVRDRFPAGRVRAVEALGAIGPAARSALPALAMVLESDSFGRAHCPAVAAIAAITRGTSDGVSLLVTALENGHLFVRRDAAIALGRLGAHAQDAIPALEKRESDREPMVRSAVRDALALIRHSVQAPSEKPEPEPAAPAKAPDEDGQGDAADLLLEQARVATGERPTVLQGCDAHVAVFSAASLMRRDRPEAREVVGRALQRLVAVRWRSPIGIFLPGNHDFVFTPDGKTLVGLSNPIRTWDLATGREIRHLVLSRPGSTRISPDGTLAAVHPFAGKETRILEVKTGRVRARLRNPAGARAYCSTFSADGAIFITAGPGPLIRVFDTATGRIRRAVRLAGQRVALAGLGVSPDSKLLAVGEKYGETLRILDLEAGQEIGNVPAHPKNDSGLTAAVYSPTGRWLATAGYDRRICLRDPQSGALRGSAIPLGETMAGSLAFGPDDAWIAAGCRDGKIRLWTLPDRALTVLDGERGRIERLAVSPDGKTLLAAGGVGRLALWDVARKSRTAELNGHWLPIGALAASRDGRLLVTGGIDQWIRVWDAKTGQARAELCPERAVPFAVAVDADAGRIAIATEKNSLWLFHRTAAGYEKSRAAVQAELRSLAYSPDGMILYAGTESGIIHALEAKTGTPRGKLTGHAGAVWSLDVDPEGKTLVSGSWDGTIRLWDLAAGKEIACLRGHRGDVHSVRFLSGGERLVSTGYDFAVRLWDVARRTPLRMFQNERLPDRAPFNLLKTKQWIHRRTVRSSPHVAVSRDGRFVACTGWDDAVRILDAATLQLRSVVPAHERGIHGIAFTADGSLATAGNDGTAAVFDLGALTGTEIIGGHHGGVMTVAYSPDGRTLISGDYQGNVRLLDLETRRARWLADHGEHAVQVAACTPDGRKLLTGDAAGVLRRYDLKSGALEQAQGGFAGGIKTFGIDREGKRVFVAPFERPIEVLDPGTFKATTELKFHWGSKHAKSLSLRPDEKLLALGGSQNDTVRIFDLTPDEMRGLPGHGYEVNAVAFSADGRFLATAGYDGKICLYDATSLRAKGTLVGHSGPVVGLAFLPGRSAIASIGRDGQMRVWSLETHKTLASYVPPGGPLYAIAAHPNGREIVVGVRDGSTHRWRMPSTSVADVSPGDILSAVETSTGLVIHRGRVRFAPPAADFTPVAPHRFKPAGRVRRDIRWARSSGAASGEGGRR